MLADKLKELRLKFNKSQKEVADYLMLSRPTYTRYETGEREPDYETLKKLALFFNVKIDYLLDQDKLDDNNYIIIPTFEEIVLDLKKLNDDNLFDVSEYIKFRIQKQNGLKNMPLYNELVAAFDSSNVTEEELIEDLMYLDRILKSVHDKNVNEKAP